MDDIAGRLLIWYQKNKRDLPWRRAHDPYAILVSEMMLCQTTVDTVLGYYDAFMARFPDVFALAAASEQAVLSTWQGLGYYNRARNLHKTAKQVKEASGGEFPKTYSGLTALPGVGAYIAGAVMSIAYNEPCPAVDGNVLRVISRLDGIVEDIASPSVRASIIARVREMMPKDHAGDFTQALMELGALVCRPQSPDCGDCPVKSRCAAYRQGVADKLPVRKQKSRPRAVKLWAVAALTPRSVLLEYRGHETLLANMWGLPVIEKKKGVSPESVMREKYALPLESSGETIGHVSHVFTHRRWEMDIICFRLDKEEAAEGLEWVRWEGLEDKPIPTAFKKAIDVIITDLERSGL